MALPNEVNVGTAPNNGTGDPLRTGAQKINANFVYLDENKQDISEKGAANGYVGLNANVKIGNEYIQMPVVPVETVPTEGQENVLYTESSTGSLKIWNGTDYDVYGGGSVSYQDVVDALGFVPEPELGNPVSNDMVLASDTEGNRYWVVQQSSGGGVTQQYVDDADAATLANAETYADSGDADLQLQIDDVEEDLTTKANLVHTHSADDVTSGTFTSTRIPQLSPTKINQNTTNRFVTDAEKTEWNGKADDVLVTNTVKGQVKPPNLTDTTTASYDLLSPASGTEFTEGDTVTLIIDVDESGGTDGVRHVPVAYRENGTTVFDWEEKGNGAINNITEIPNRSYNDLQDKLTSIDPDLTIGDIGGTPVISYTSDYKRGQNSESANGYQLPETGFEEKYDTFYTFTGTTNADWYLPVLTGNSNFQITITNNSDFTLTINSNTNTSSDDISDKGSVVNSVTLLAGETIKFHNNTKWTVISKY